MDREPDENGRIERDSLGEISVPMSALWGAEKQRAIENFPISGLRLPRPFIRALGWVKGAAAEANHELGLLDPNRMEAIREAADEVADGIYDAQFPVDVFQSGSGTSTNMNANEVIARLAAQRLSLPVHPNDHINLGQSSNDVIPTAIHISASVEVRERLLPSLDHLTRVIEERAGDLCDVVKTGRTHLMDAMPIRFDQELSGWSSQIHADRDRIDSALSDLQHLAIGGTAVGTGIQTHAQFAERFVSILSRACRKIHRP